MPWDEQKGKLLYRFPSYKGWNPSQTVIRGQEDFLYDMKNLRVGKDGVLSVRGGWSQFSTGDTDITSLFGFKTGDNIQKLVSVSLPSTGNGILRQYDFAAEDWDATNLLYYRFLSRGKQDFITIPRSDGKDILVMTDGVNPNLKWDMEKVPTELTSSIGFDGETGESWTFSDAGTLSETKRRTGKYSVKLTDNSAGGDTGTVVYGGPVFSLYDSIGNTFNTTYRIGDLSTVERDFAIWSGGFFSEEVTFDQVEIYLKPSSSPTGNITVTLETDDGGEPSGTLIHANATNTGGDAGPTAEGWHTITLDGSVTYGQPFWLVFDAAAQGTDAHWQVFHTSASAWTSSTSDDGKSTWTLRSGGPQWRLVQSGSALDWGTAYATLDEIILWIYLDGTLTDIDLDNSSIDFRTDGSNRVTYVFTSDTITSGQWNQLIIPRQSTTTGNWTLTGTMDWSSLSSIVLTLTDGGSDATIYFDQCYIRKTRVDSDSGTATRPYLAKFCEVSPHGDRLLLANTQTLESENLDESSGPQYIWYSDTYNIDNFTSTNFISMPESITGMKTYGGLVHVFSQDKRWIIEPNYNAAVAYTSSTTQLDWKIVAARGPGCVSNRSIVEGKFGEEHGIFFLSKDGVYFTNGMEAVKVSGPLDVLFKEPYSSSADFYSDMVDPVNWEVACAGMYQGRYYLSYYGKGDSNNSATIILNTETGKWEKDINSGAVFPRMYTVSNDLSTIPQLFCCADNGEVYNLVPNRTTLTDDGNAYAHYFQTPYIGNAILHDLNWETLFLWVKSDETDALDLRIAMYELDPDESNFNNWDESLATAKVTASFAHTPTAFRWTRLRIQLVDKDTSGKFLSSRACSFKIWDANNEPVDFIPEMVVCTMNNDELAD